jgi:hypothetical protein
LAIFFKGICRHIPPAEQCDGAVPAHVWILIFRRESS